MRRLTSCKAMTKSSTFEVEETVTGIVAAVVGAGYEKGQIRSVDTVMKNHQKSIPPATGTLELAMEGELSRYCQC